MKRKSASVSIFHIPGIILLILGLAIGASQPVVAQDISTSPALVDPPFQPLRLAAPNCTYGGLIKSVTATGQYTVTFELCRPDAVFISKIAMPVFAIYPQEWIEATSGDTNRTTQGLEHPIGTGPYKVSTWDRGTNLVLVKNSGYWGTAPQTDMLVFRWGDDPAQRLLALQSGALDGMDSPAPEDYAAITADTDLQLVTRPNLNTLYLGMTNTFIPFNDVRIRQAVAMGIDRQHLIDTYYPAGSVVATHFTPCSIPNGCAGNDWYTYDVTAAKALMTAAGYPSGFPTHLYYRDVVRSYLPRAAEVAQDIHDQLLVNLGIDAMVVAMESGEFIPEVQAGHINGFYLLGWAVDYPHVSNFLDFHFGQNNVQFGDPFPAIYDELNAALGFADPLDAEPYYTDANNAIRELVPMVPIAHGSSAVAYLADVTNPQASPLGYADVFSNSDPGSRSIFRWMQFSEPTSLFCADESDIDSYRACTQVMEPLYNFMPNDVAVEPALAESCVPNAGLTIYVCTLRQGVTFHDGTGFDANDVVETFAMGLDVSSPYHKGNSNVWDYYNSIFGLMDTALYTISGNTGVGDAILSYVDAGNRTAYADANGDYSFKVSNGWSGTVTPSKAGVTFFPVNRTYTNVLSDKVDQNYFLAMTASYKSTGTQDGWILETSETSSLGGTLNSTDPTFNLGDAAADKQYRSILSFNTTALPDTAVITKVTLKIKRSVLLGTNPFTILGGLKVDIRKPFFGATVNLLAGDFQAAASRVAVGTFGTLPVSNWYTAVIGSTGYPYINKTGTTQFRLYFYKGDNDDNGTDYMKFFSGNYALASARPTLIIQYYLP